MENEKKLFLLDGFALIYRAYFAFAKNPRINSKGLDTSAIFGFTNTLNEVIRKENPSHIAVVFDRSAPTKRHIEYPEYKAQRDAMPDGIREALPYIDKLLEAFNIPKLYKDGFEADDVIGTLAKKAEEKGYKTYMMTSDKDFAQLVSENIFMYRPGNKWQPTTILGVPEVLEKFNITRIDQVIDFLGMMGDTADNIPGIPGVGKKTAQKFLKKYDTMEGLFANSNDLKGKMKENIESSEAIGLLCKKLVTIITDVPIGLDENNLKYEPINIKKTTELFEELEFRTLLQRITPKKETASTENSSQSAQFELFSQSNSKIKTNINLSEFDFIEDIQETKDIIIEIRNHKEFSFQLITDTDNALTGKITGVAVSYLRNKSYYFPFNDSNKGLIRNLLNDETLKLIGFDVKSAIKILNRHDIEIKGKLFDVQIAHYLLHPDTRNSLDIISENYLGIILTEKSSILGKGKTKLLFSELKADLITNYACERSLSIFNLFKILEKEMIESRVIDLFEKMELPLSEVLARMELEGIALDVKMLDNLSVELTKKLEIITSTIHNLAGTKFNIASPKQMGELLFEKMKLNKKPKKTKSGQYATSEEELLKLKGKHPIIEEILTFRGIKKLLSTYVDALPNLVNTETHRIHTTFNQSVASTGRLSSVNPNIQNIPIRTEIGMKVREAFVPRNNTFTLMSADYSQIELRIMASLSKDEGMLTAFNNGIDIHSATAAKVYNVPVEEVDRIMRSNAKSVNFGIIYGISAFGLSQNIGVSRKEAGEIINNYFEQFPKVREYMQWSIDQARDKEYVETIMGRRRYLKNINAKNGMIRAMAERNAINAPIQGSAADIIKIAMIEVDKEIVKRNMKSRMLLQVHDELIFDMHKSEADVLKSLVKEKMEQAVSLQVPLIVDIGEGDNWLKAH
ncbi:MAG: DNA polymerase I [Flavobacteriales bacterium]|nr:DNA polymerase I [Flavobacteriales bacterium]